MSTARVAIVDVGLGNLHSVAKAFERADASVQLTRDPNVVAEAERVVFPGQGAFRECAQALTGALGASLVERIRADKPYLGICLGMQALFEASDEAPEESGLSVFEGRVERFAAGLVDADGRRLKIPHMGWNQVQTSHPLLEQDAWYYFVHSYHCVPGDTSLIAATADYGGPFCAAIGRGRLFACQFHPEKSQHAGARLIRRFMEADRWN